MDTTVLGIKSPGLKINSTLISELIFICTVNLYLKGEHDKKHLQTSSRHFICELNISFERYLKNTIVMPLEYCI